MASDNPTLDTVFCAAIEIGSAEERAAYIARACGDDQDLRRRVEALVAAHFRAGSFLESPAAGAGATRAFAARETAPAAVPQQAAGAVFGPYRLVRQIGEGGMGAVWMAEQAQPVQRTVALKLVKPGLDSGQVLARFEAERQALALMDHPNIARVFDAGSTADGRPYFVMELVQGVPITTYGDQHRLTPRQRLELFVPVCQAVQHAHQKGVIHRDLKPSNVLVTLYDGRPVPKVIDFGIAKAAGQKPAERATFTELGQVVGTLEYMSPEQAGLNQLDIDTRSDVYSLGVLLYELLTGSTPLEKRRLKEAALLEVLRLIREEEPPRPSTRLSTTDELPAVAARRGLEPRKLSGLVRGELDWMVMKALEKERDRRYESANGLAADVQRYLADEPVLACPPSAWYRFRKFARRHKAPLAVAALVLFFIALLGGGGGWVVRDREAREEQAAKERLDRERRLTDQVEQILGEVDRLEREQKWPEALAAARRAEAALAGGEAGDAIRQCVRDVLRDLAFVARIDRIRQDRALVIEGKLNNRGAVEEYGRAFRAYGADVETLPTEEAVARLRARPLLVVAVAAALDDWVTARRQLGEHAPSWKALVGVARGIDGDPLRDRLRAVWGQQAPPELQAELRQLAESIDVKAQSPATLVTLAWTLLDVGLVDSAIQILRDGQPIYPGDFWLSYALGLRLLERKDYTQAVRYFSVAVAIRPDSAGAHVNLAVALERSKDLEGAIREHRAALRIDRNNARVHFNLGTVLYYAKDLEGAIREFHAALRIDPNYATAHCNLGLALCDKKDVDGAIREFHAALRIDPNIALAHNNLGLALCDKKDVDGAIREFHVALQIEPNYASARYNLGLALHEKKDLDGAVREFHAAVQIDPNHALAHWNLGNTLLQLGEIRDALAELRRGHELGSKNPGWPIPSAEIVRQCERLAELDVKLPGFLEGKATPASADERIDLGQLCSLKRLNRAAARFYEEAFADQPQLSDELHSHRYNAARVAALACCAQGRDAAGLDQKERSRLRRQALAWLRADLEAWGRRLEKEPGQLGSASVGLLQHWLRDPAFAGVRGPEALAKLPEAERQAWQKLWTDVAAMLKRAQGTTESENK
jgi:serine/threonine protein kinase/Tfp pilus assembly protein PilF